MKKSIILMISILIALVGIVLSGQSAYALDPPHNQYDTSFYSISCSVCHVDTTVSGTPTWVSDSTDTDHTIFNNLCTSCHSSLKMDQKYAEVATHAAGVLQSTKYWQGNWTNECRTCHNPHYQQQVINYNTDSTVSVVSGSVVSLSTNATWSITSMVVSNVSLTGNYAYYILVPNTVYPTRMYRISSTTANSISVYGALNPNYTGPGKTFSIRYGQLLKNQITAPNGVVWNVKLFNSSGPNSYATNTTPVSGVCQVCHTQTHSYTNTGQMSDPVKHGTDPDQQPGGNCTTCHTHKSGFKGPAVGGCTNCHGNPPSVDQAGSPGVVGTGASNSVFLPTGATSPPSAGGHLKHASTLGMACATCHSNSIMTTTVDKNIRMGFAINSSNYSSAWQGGAVTTATFETFNALTNGYSWTNAPGTTFVSVGNNNNTCRNLYCHGGGVSGGVPPLTGGTNTAPSWVGGSAQAQCGTCHGNTAATYGTPGSHGRHVGTGLEQMGLACSDCHGTITSSHVNGNANWNINNSNQKLAGGTYRGSQSGGTGVLAPSTYSGTYGSCTNIYCHSNAKTGTAVASYATVTWGGSALQCYSCHGGTTSSGYPDYANSGPSTTTANSHPMHVSTSAIGCQVCHYQTTTTGNSITGTRHVDLNTQDVYFSGLAAGGSYNTSGKSCSSVYCHGSSTPAWGGSTDCASCHNASNALAGKHSIHYAVTTTAQASDRTPADNSVAGNYVFSCGVCHNGAPHASSPTSTWEAADVIFDTNVAGGGTYNGGTTTAGVDRGFNWTAPNGACSNIYCHSQGDKTVGPYTAPNVATYNWSNTTLTCSGCHGGLAANASPIASGTHTKHITSSTYNVSCDHCHYATTTTGNSITDKTKHVNKTKDVAWDPTIGGGTAYNNGAKTCSNIYCHSQGTAGSAPYTASNMTATWGVTFPTDCTGCHNGAPTASKLMTSGSHSKHVGATANGGSNQGCIFCHNATVSGTTAIGNYANHVNKKVDIAFTSLNPTAKLNSIWSSTAKDPGTSPVTCSSLYCHGTSGAPTWGTDNGTLNCASCHNASNVLAGKHSVHYATTTTALQSDKTPSNHSVAGSYIFTCGVCHYNTNHATGPTTTWEAADVVFDSTYATYSGGGTYNGGTTTAGVDNGFNWTAPNGACSNIYCHSQGDKTVGPYTAPNVATYNWNNTTLTCAGCHGGLAANATPIASGKHTKHITSASYNISCDHCHYATTTTGNTITDKTKHVNKTKDVAWDPTFVAGGTAYNIGTQTCSNIYCHSQGTTASAPYLASLTTATWGGSLNCSGCHGNSVATLSSGAHAMHLSTTIATGSITCSNCHNATAIDSSNLASGAAGTYHVNRNVTINFSSSSTVTSMATYSGTAAGLTNIFDKAVASPKGSCNNTLCHGGKSAVWDQTTTSADCVKCHGVPGATTAQYNANTALAAPGYISVSSPTGTGYNTSRSYGTLSGFDSVSTDTKVGAHYAHVTSNGLYSAPIACSVCHENVTSIATTNHLGGSTTFAWSFPSNTGGLTPNYNSSTAQCSTNWCHGGGLPAVNRGSGTTPVWTNASYITSTSNATGSPANCQLCHQSPPLFKSDGTTSHPTQATMSPPNCNGCHNHNGTGANHINGIIEAAGGACNDCHWYDTTDAGAWSSPEPSPSGSLLNVQAAWGAHIDHINHLKKVTNTTLNPSSDTFGGPAFTAVCGVCHTVTESYHQNVPARLITFGDGSTLHQFSTGATMTYKMNTTKTCSNIDCHFKETPQPW